MTSPTVDRRFGLVGNIAMKAPVTAIATGNVVLSGEQTIDGVAVKAVNAAGVADRVLCVGQTDTTQNGIWDVSTAPWTRSLDANGNYDLGQGSTVLVNQGAVNAGSYWKIVTSAPITIGSTLMAWTRALASSISTLFFLQSGTGAVARGAQDKMREWVSVLDFGADPTGVADSLAAFNAAIAFFDSFNSAPFGNGGIVRVPRGTYKLSGTLTLDKSVLLEGESYPAANNSGVSRLQFSTDADGIKFGWYNGTHGTAKATLSNGAKIKNLYIKGTKAGGSGNGVFMNARGYIENCFIDGFSGNGILVSATTPTDGNANNWGILAVDSVNHGGHGLYVVGSDANAGFAMNLNCSTNGGWGIYDSSFLGNTYLACHTAANTTGAYKTDNPNGQSVFVGCYSEGGQPASSIVGPSMFIGGLAGAGFTDTSTGAIMQAQGGAARQLLVRGSVAQTQKGTTNTVSNTLGGQPDSGTILFSSTDQFTDTDFRLQWGTTFGQVVQASFLNGLIPFWMTGFDTTFTGGKSSVQKGVLVVPALYIGGGGDTKQLAFGPAAPVAGDWSRGDIVKNSSPAVGQPKGWVCTVTGTPGTWVSEGNL